MKIITKSVHELSAKLNVKINRDCNIEIIIEGKCANSELSYDYNYQVNKGYVDVIGLYANHLNNVTLVIDNKKFNHSIEVGNFETKFVANAKNITNFEMKNKLLFCTTKGEMFGIDINGDIRFNFKGYELNPSSQMIEFTILRNNGLYSFNYVPAILFDKLDNVDIFKKVRNINKFGNVQKEYINMDGYGLHHDLIKLKNGNVITLDNAKEYKESLVIEFDINLQKIREFDLHEIFPVDMKLGVVDHPKDIAHINSIDYNEELNEILFSSRHMCCFFGVDYDTFELKWVIIDPEFIDESFSSKCLKLEEGNYTYGSHTARYFEVKGQLDYKVIVYDNNNETDSQIQKYKNNSFARMYHIKDQVAKEIFSYDTKVNSEYISSVQIEGDNVVISSGGIGGPPKNGLYGFNSYIDIVNLNSKEAIMKFEVNVQTYRCIINNLNDLI